MNLFEEASASSPSQRYVRIRVSGKVTGVYFRKFTRQIALSLDLAGFVQNQSDGSVAIEAQGESAKIDKLIEWCQNGPSAARVTSVEVTELNGKPSYHSFVIRKSA